MIMVGVRGGGVRRRAIAGALVLGPALALAVAACGPGQNAALTTAAAAARTGPTPTNPVTATSTASPRTTGRTTVVVVPLSSTLPTPPPTTVVVAPPPPQPVPECANTRCQTVFSLDLGGGNRLAGLRFTGADGSASGALAYWHNGKLIDHRGLPESQPEPAQVPVGGRCDPAGATGQRCVVAFTVGPHSIEAFAILLRPTSQIQVTSTALGDAGQERLADLGNHVTDVALLQSTFQPSYASAPVAWQTWLDENGRLVSTGCGPVSPRGVAPPTRPLTGACPR